MFYVSSIYAHTVTLHAHVSDAPLIPINKTQCNLVQKQKGKNPVRHSTSASGVNVCGSTQLGPTLRALKQIVISVLSTLVRSPNYSVTDLEGSLTIKLL